MIAEKNHFFKAIIVWVGVFFLISSAAITAGEWDQNSGDDHLNQSTNHTGTSTKRKKDKSPKGAKEISKVSSKVVPSKKGKKGTSSDSKNASPKDDQKENSSSTPQAQVNNDADNSQKNKGKHPSAKKKKSPSTASSPNQEAQTSSDNTSSTRAAPKKKKKGVFGKGSFFKKMMKSILPPSKHQSTSKASSSASQAPVSGSTPAFDPYDQTGLPAVTVDPPPSTADLLAPLPWVMFMPPGGLKNVDTMPNAGDIDDEG